MTVPPNFPANAPEAPPAPEPRSSTGWVMLTVILALLIAIALVGYLGKRETRETSYNAYEDALRNAVRVERMGQRMSWFRAPHGPLLDGAVSDLVDRRKKEPRAAALYVVMRHEQGNALREEDLTILRGSTQPEHRTLARIYAPGKPSPLEMRNAAQALSPEKGIVYRVARAHALERAGVPNARQGLVSTAAILVPFFVLAGGCILLPIGVAVWIALAAGVGAGAEPAPLRPGKADAYALRGAQAFLAFIGLPILASPLGLLGVKGPVGTVLVSAFVFGGLALLYRYIPVLGQPITFRSVGFSAARLGRHIALGVGVGLVNFPVAGLLGIIGTYLFRFLPEPQHPAAQALMARQDFVTVVSLLLAASVFAPLIEETIFRGTLFPALSSRFGSPIWGGFVSSFAFAAMHPQGIPLWLTLGALGAMGCLLTYRTNSLIPAIAMHATHNTIALMIGLAMAS